MGILIQDIRYAARMMLKQPVFTAVAVVALALGIGANTAIFTVVNAVLLRPLPYDDPDHLVWLWDTLPQLATAPTSLPEFIDWRSQNQSFEYVAAYQSGNMFFDDGNSTEDTPVGLVTPDLFSLFRVKPLLGRTFTEEETRPGRFRVAVISQSLWQRRFGSDPNVLGRTVQLSGAASTIIGVIPAGFSFPNEAQLWRPLPIDPNKLDRGPHYLRVVGRLKPAVTLPQAQAEMSTIASRLAVQYPEKTAGHGIKLELLSKVVVGDIGPALFVLLGAVGFVLLIACANVANLQLARAGAPKRDRRKNGAWSQPHAHHTAVADREHSAGSRRGRGRFARGGLGRQFVGVLESRHNSPRSRDRHRCSGCGLHAVDFSGNRSGVRSRACVASLKARPDRCAQRERPDDRRGSSESTSQFAGGLRDCIITRPVDRRGIGD
jgi:hypothetical protein